MKTRKIIVEVICLVLMLNFFYEGIYKIFYWPNFNHWMANAPLVKSAGAALSYIIPIGEIGLSFMFLMPLYRNASLYCTLAILILFILWIISMYLFSHSFVWPYHSIWKKSVWMQKMIVSLGLGWLALFAIILSNSEGSPKKLSSKFLRNKPANAQ